jgi:hypothetical protein
MFLPEEITGFRGKFQKVAVGSHQIYRLKSSLHFSIHIQNNRDPVPNLQELATVFNGTLLLPVPVGTVLCPGWAGIGHVWSGTHHVWSDPDDSYNGAPGATSHTPRPGH